MKTWNDTGDRCKHPMGMYLMMCARSTHMNVAQDSLNRLGMMVSLVTLCFSTQSTMESQFPKQKPRQVNFNS